MRHILRIAIPNGLENGVAQSIWSLAALAGVSMGPVFITVIGQCMWVTSILILLVG